MFNSKSSQNSLLTDIFISIKSLPTWVIIWVFVWLVPVNLASLFFLKEPMGIWVAVLANLGMLPNIFVMVNDRGVSKLMSIPHLLPWTLLVALILIWRPEGSSTYNIYLMVLLVTNTISLIFDYPDSFKWFKGDRSVAGR